MKKIEPVSGLGRRDFIKTAAIFAGGTLFTSAIGISDQSVSDEKVRLGIIGIGIRGRLLVKHLKSVPGAEIVAICDDYEPNFTRAMKMTHGRAKGFSDYRKLLELKDIDAVVIATPLHEHARMTIDALEAGKHVFCEKSMARTIEECYNMMIAHRKAGKILQIGHQRMFNEKYLKAVGMIKEGFIGPVTQIRAYWHRNNDWRRRVPSPGLERKINWRLYREYSAGLMTELACHQIQIGNWLLGTPPESVMGSGSLNYWNKDERDVYDNVNLIYNYPDGVKMVYDSMISNGHYGFEEQIMGPKGNFELEIGKYYLESPPPAPGILQLINDIEKGIFETVPIGGASWVPETASGAKGYYIMNNEPNDDGTYNEMKSFVDFVRKGTFLPGLAEEGYYSGIASLMGEEAMHTMKTVYWPSQYNI